MYDTYMTVVGNVLTAPEWRRTTTAQILVANFKVASTSRRYDRETERWIDGHSFRVRVNCWRRLAEGVASSLMVGDPVIVVGRLYTRDWTDENQQHRVMYEMEAVAVGHDLSRGRGRFHRTRAAATTSAIEGAEADARVQGELAQPVPPGEVPARYGDGIPDDADDFDPMPRLGGGAGFDPLGALATEGFDGIDNGSSYRGLGTHHDERGPRPDWPIGQEHGITDTEGSRDPADDDGDADDGDPDVPEDPDGVASSRRTRRRVRTPVPA